MHVVVLRREVYEQRPWLAQSLYKAFEQARREAAARLAETAAGASLLPWGYAEAERTRNLMGADFWTYGLAGNERTLGTFVRYSFEQGLIKRQLRCGGAVRGRDPRGVRDLTPDGMPRRPARSRAALRSSRAA